MDDTEIEVKQLQIELAELKPLMEKAALETAKVIERIAIDSVRIINFKYNSVMDLLTAGKNLERF